MAPKKQRSLYREEDCIKNFCISLREHTVDVINFTDKLIPLTEKEL